MLGLIHDWHRLSLVKRGVFVHATTDPACALYRQPRAGSRLDIASRGWSCPRCVGAAVDAHLKSPDSGSDS